MLKQPSDARPVFEASAEIRTELNQANLRLEVLAGLAQAYFLESNLGVARQLVNQIWQALESGISLDGEEEPLRVYHDCYQILLASEDERAPKMLQMGYLALQESISNITNENTRRMVVENVPWRQALLDEWKRTRA